MAERETADGPDSPPARITPYRNGPYLVRGPFTLVDQDGNEIEVKRRVVALCRCGRSKMRPFCDGTHKAVRFRAESGVVEPPDQDDVLAESEALAPEST
ncbi:MAG TPA: CDGSH iron-sulfur domain-containing protein [Solirubrobacterales bacterium]|nr:CDGSH iron-sulfur domain-containing protein [Solirubrobacterales bacterium]